MKHRYFDRPEPCKTTKFALSVFKSHITELITRKLIAREIETDKLKLVLGQTNT